MTPRPILRLFQVLLGIALGLSVAFLWARGRGPATPEVGSGDGYFLPSPLPAPEFTLTSQEGVRLSSADFPGKILIVFFGYTSCPDVCPLTLSNLTRAFEEMNEDGERMQVLFITVDPARDTPERLKVYLSNFHSSFLGLTGREEEVRTVADGFGAWFSNPGAGEDYTVEHTARTFVVDRFGRIPLTFPVTATPDEMARDLTTLFEISGG
ncbi:MAG: SCO family protein [Longimicrobiales bacterium]